MSTVAEWENDLVADLLDAESIILAMTPEERARVLDDGRKAEALRRSKASETALAVAIQMIEELRDALIYGGRAKAMQALDRSRPGILEALRAEVGR